MKNYYCVNCGEPWNGHHSPNCCYDGIVIMTECTEMHSGIHADIDPSGACCAEEEVKAIPVCAKCKGKGVIITDILNGATKPCECREVAEEKPKQALSTIGQLMGMQAIKGFPQSLHPGGFVPIPPDKTATEVMEQYKQAICNANPRKG